MSEEQQQHPPTTMLCKMGCGFFGSSTSGDCCSKCWREKTKEEEKSNADAVVSTNASMDVKKSPISETSKILQKSEVKETRQKLDFETSKTVVVATPNSKAKVEKKPPKKKKTKLSYKNMLTGMLKPSKKHRDVEAEKQALRKVTGGGAFTKVDKI
eukprot:CAMPEP_0196826024 /NCGR_PEP_ID=MMETSP1362-20130617/93397_1 /TAXON_ID=163516 /ORGANISM="Leptocylindrus danicus, Strain CCMP1856" /LENGTH=155 /DNA_ID=CAMNT_0042206553 /DNA_START=480 /DNA_END=947 /DNA_ORIENTATION=+